MTLNELAQKALPELLYQRLSASSIAKRLAKGSLWSLFGSATSRVLILVAMILVARILGKGPYGEFGLIQATLGMAGLMAGMGLGGTATRFVAQYAIIDPDRTGRVIALIMSTSLATVLLATGLLIAVSGFISRVLLEAPHLQSALILGSVLMAATAFRGIQGGVFAGLEKFDIIAKLNILDGVVSLVAMVLLTRFMGVKGALLGLATGAAVVWFAGRLLLMSELKNSGITVKYKGCWADRQILSGYSLPSLLVNLVATPVLWLSMMLLSKTEHGFAELGLYNAAYQWHGPVVFIPMIFMSVSIPILVQEWEAGKRDRFRRVAWGICGLTLCMALPSAALVALLSPWIMSLYGHEFREGWMVLILLLAAAPVHGISHNMGSVLLSMNRAWLVVLANSIWGFSLIVLSFFFIPSKGALGLAGAFLFAYLIVTIVQAIMIFVVSSENKLNT